MISFIVCKVTSRHIFRIVIGLLSLEFASSFHAMFSGPMSTKFDTFFIASRSKPKSQIYQSLTSYHTELNFNAVSRRNAMLISSIAFSSAFTQPQSANADVSDGNALPKGAQEFARTLKLKADIKDVTKRLLSASADNEIDKKEWDNIGKFLRTVYSTAENDMKGIAKGLSYNPDNQERAYSDVDEIKKYSQAGDVSVSKQDAARLATILAKISEILEDFLSSLSDVPDEI